MECDYFKMGMKIIIVFDRQKLEIKDGILLLKLVQINLFYLIEIVDIIVKVYMVFELIKIELNGMFLLFC